MIYKNGKEVIEIYYQDENLDYVYVGRALVWQKIRSCYGTGKWVPEKPWIDTDLWRNI